MSSYSAGMCGRSSGDSTVSCARGARARESKKRGGTFENDTMDERENKNKAIDSKGTGESNS